MGMSLPFPDQCRAAGLPAPVAEFVFAPPRRWRFDWAWPEQRVALEQDGGAFVGGRHSRGMGFVKDMEKTNKAAILGWRVLRFTPRQMASGAALEAVRQALEGSS